MYLYALMSLIISIHTFLADGTPEFRGGKRGLRSFIESHLIYPEFAKANCLQGTVQVSFKLDRQGRIFESHIEHGYGIDLDLEALRIVRLSSGRWIVPQGYDTLNSIVLPVNFILRDFKCEARSKDEIQAAIAAYQAREGLTSAIFNFYDKKAAGSFNPEDEFAIKSLKLQLGYDDRFIDRLLKQAQRKLKQGDEEGACEDFITIRRLGSNSSENLIRGNCDVN